jgi:hypothetical protein
VERRSPIVRHRLEPHVPACNGDVGRRRRTGADGLVDVQEVGERVPAVGVALQREVLLHGEGTVFLCARRDRFMVSTDRYRHSSHYMRAMVVRCGRTVNRASSEEQPGPAR